MDKMLCVLWTIFGIFPLLNGIVGATEYCSGETFSPHCADNEVIVMQNASFGLMKRTRCTSNPIYTPYIGCSNEALSQLDRECSGQKICHLSVSQDDFENTNACPEALRQYLEVEYRCLKVEDIPFDCLLPPSQPFTSTAISNKCGTPQKPLHLKASPGQNIELRVMDFTYMDGTSISRSCVPIGYMAEDVVKVNKTICGASRLRDNVLYRSVSHEINIVLTQRQNEHLHGEYIIHHLINGCPDPALAPGTVYKRDGEAIEYRCFDEDSTHMATCVNGIWDTAITNCSGQGYVDKDTENTEQPGTILSEGILIGIIIGVAVILSIVVLVCGVVIANRRGQPGCTKNDMYAGEGKLSSGEFKLYQTLPKSNCEGHVLVKDYNNSLPGTSFPKQYYKEEICDCECMQ